jgi:hypothetical protein
LNKPSLILNVSFSMIEVRHYAPPRRDEWDNFVLHSNNGTIFHLQRFFSYHPHDRFLFHHLLFYSGGRLIALLPAAITENGTCLESPIGASYGGFVLPWEMKYVLNEHLVDALLDYAQKQGFKKILLTHAPPIYQTRLCQDIDYALAFKGFDFDRHYISHAIHLDRARISSRTFPPLPADTFINASATPTSPFSTATATRDSMNFIRFCSTTKHGTTPNLLTRSTNSIA